MRLFSDHDNIKMWIGDSKGLSNTTTKIKINGTLDDWNGPIHENDLEIFSETFSDHHTSYCNKNNIPIAHSWSKIFSNSQSNHFPGKTNKMSMIHNILQVQFTGLHFLFSMTWSSFIFSSLRVEYYSNTGNIYVW